VPPKAAYFNNVCSYSTSSTTLVDVDSDNLTLSIDTTGGDVLVLVTANISITGTYWTDRVNLGLRCDGVVGQSARTGYRLGNNDNKIVVSFYNVFSDLTAFEHEFVLQWSVTGATSATMTQVAMLVQEIG